MIEKKIEEEKRIKYNPDNIFENNNKNTTIFDEILKKFIGMP